MKFNIKLWATLLFIGLLGVASLLLSDLPLDLPKEVSDRFTSTQIKFLILANPTLLVLIMTTIGTLCYQKVNLEVPILDQFLNQKESNIALIDIIKSGILLGILAGVGIVGIGKLFESQMPAELVTASKNMSLSIISKIMYGGITEEILIRFGLMSLVLWIANKLFKSLSAFSYWFAIVFCAFIFGMGHLPLLKQLVPDPSVSMYAYIILGNMIAGILFGYAYWKKGLESAFIAHAVAHLTMVGLEAVS